VLLDFGLDTKRLMDDVVHAASTRSRLRQSGWRCA